MFDGLFCCVDCEDCFVFCQSKVVGWAFKNEWFGLDCFTETHVRGIDDVFLKMLIVCNWECSESVENGCGQPLCCDW